MGTCVLDVLQKAQQIISGLVKHAGKGCVTEEARSLSILPSQQRFTSHTQLRLEPTSEWLIMHERQCFAGAHRSALQRSASKQSCG